MLDQPIPLLVSTSDFESPNIAAAAPRGDLIEGTAHGDRLRGLGGDDTLLGGGGSDSLHGGSGRDILDGGSDTDFLFGGTGADTLLGGFNTDSLIGGDGRDLLDGGEGNDTLEGGAGQDTLNGGSGEDDVYFIHSHVGVVVDLGLGRATGEGTDVLVSIEDAHGGRHADLIVGSDANNFLSGLAGGDTLAGGDGNDFLLAGDGHNRLVGGAGADLLWSGDDKDVFAFLAIADSGPGGADTINNLSSDDRIDLSAIDADTTQAGDQAFVRVAAFDGHAGELAVSFDAVSHGAVIEADVDGDGAADLIIMAPGAAADVPRFVL